MSERNKRERKVSVRYRDYVDVPSEDEEPRKGGKGGYDKKFKGAGAAGGPSGLGGAGGPASAAAGPYAYESSTGEEKRMDATGRSVRWSGKPSQAMKERIARAMPGDAPLMFLLETREVAPASAPSGRSQQFFVLGSDNQVHRVTLQRAPVCSCDDNAAGNICAHMLFVTMRCLKLPPDEEMVYQKAYLTKEIEDVLAGRRSAGGLRAATPLLAPEELRAQWRAEAAVGAARVVGGGAPVLPLEKQDCPITGEALADVALLGAPPPPPPPPPPFPVTAAAPPPPPADEGPKPPAAEGGDAAAPAADGAEGEAKKEEPAADGNGDAPKPPAEEGGAVATAPAAPAEAPPADAAAPDPAPADAATVVSCFKCGHGVSVAGLRQWAAARRTIHGPDAKTLCPWCLGEWAAAEDAAGGPDSLPGLADALGAPPAANVPLAPPPAPPPPPLMPPGMGAMPGPPPLPPGALGGLPPGIQGMPGGPFGGGLAGLGAMPPGVYAPPPGLGGPGGFAPPPGLGGPGGFAPPPGLAGFPPGGNAGAVANLTTAYLSLAQQFQQGGGGSGGAGGVGGGGLGGMPPGGAPMPPMPQPQAMVAPGMDATALYAQLMRQQQQNAAAAASFLPPGAGPPPPPPPQPQQQ